MPRVHVGLSTLRGDIEKYKARFDIVELRPVDTTLPRPGRLRSYRKAVPPSFVFSVMMPRAVAALTRGREYDEALATALEVARATEARCLVISTPASVRPTEANRRRLAELVAALPRSGAFVFWEPRGLWERDEIIATARTLKVSPVFDVARDDPAPGPTVYTRLRALGKTAALSAASIERIAERLRGRKHVFVLTEAVGDAVRLRAELPLALARQTGGGVGPIVRPGVPARLIAEDEEQ